MKIDNAAGIHLPHNGRVTRRSTGGLHHDNGDLHVDTRSTGGLDGAEGENPVTEVSSGEKIQRKNNWRNEPCQWGVFSADSLTPSTGDLWTVPIRS